MSDTRQTWAGKVYVRQGERRRVRIDFADVREVAAGDNPTGTPTVAVSGSGLTVSSPAIAATTAVDFWLIVATDAAAGDRTLTVEVVTVAGAEIVRIATVTVES